ncbi:MAG TPA: hypothetical protein VK762_35875 [Polyangiaceae bacterium]|jgi:hypothetical protein|nr:hypothetical protein [Polyangiaceae bacterium]
MRLVLTRIAAAAAACFFWAVPATAQTVVDVCSTTEPSCGDGTCCATSDVCCPDPADGCCNEATPYCCGGGACAASPSACPPAASGAAAPSCNAYDVPCGPGCIAAGADCCDSAGHYCHPGLTCPSALTCSDGTRAGLAASSAAPPLAPVSPLSDPPDAVSRSCAMTPARVAPRLSPLCLLGAAAVLALRRRRARVGPGG